DDHNNRYMSNVGNAAVFSRRRMLERSCLGFGSIVLADLLKADAKPSSTVPVYSDLAARSTHFPAKAKAVIQLVQNGGPSQMDLFDPKPELTRRAGQPHPDGVEIHQPNNHNILLASPFEFRKFGQCGMDISEALPHKATIVAHLGFVLSLINELNPPEPLPPGAQRASLDYLAKLNGAHLQDHPGESELEARIQNFELAARMQLAAGEILDLSKETEATRKLYGLDNPKASDFGM